ncbi:hypothetical protein T4B_9975 [Trichinella pseudospiralis]|uniref:Uncharacterized protein n=1 Tax=Trichinella pseudospiralis TaxID=6337 RepID=A0A0V1IQF6_TRIPS|nr:hypothetical protein T4A_7872 [Trichinella pseudospiralis]KRZ25026.1 hypothetical protein T4B_9975 [Trichinella pseudospiralis]KRZ34448.1 hypothetical protein T4C_2905 [Trichinella pseudospiralis]
MHSTSTVTINSIVAYSHNFLENYFLIKQILYNSSCIAVYDSENCFSYSTLAYTFSRDASASGQLALWFAYLQDGQTSFMWQN